MISSLVVKLQNWLPKLPCNLFVESHWCRDFIFRYLGNSTSDGNEVLMKPNFGPLFTNPIRTIQDVESNRSRCTWNFRLRFWQLNWQGNVERWVPLIGFAGSPWTIMCYAVEGQGSKSFDKPKVLFLTSEAAHVLYKKSLIRLFYIWKKSKSGVDAVQIFDSWEECYLQLIIKVSWKYINKLLKLWRSCSGYCFRKGCWFALNEMGVELLLWVDWTCSQEMQIPFRWKHYKEILIKTIISIPVIKKMVHEMIDEFGKDKYIANLGRYFTKYPCRSRESICGCC
jgi:uroporphyrinogen decarboxylase